MQPQISLLILSRHSATDRLPKGSLSSPPCKCAYVTQMFQKFGGSWCGKLWWRRLGWGVGGAGGSLAGWSEVGHGGWGGVRYGVVGWVMVGQVAM